MAFHYFTQKLHIAKTGKALAGWPNPNIHVSAPTLKACRTFKNYSLLEGFMGEMWYGVSVSRLSGNDLKPFRDAVTASLLIWYKSVKEDLGSESPLLQKMHDSALARQVSLRVLAEWGEDIKRRFTVDNA